MLASQHTRFVTPLYQFNFNIDSFNSMCSVYTCIKAILILTIFENVVFVYVCMLLCMCVHAYQFVHTRILHTDVCIRM